MQKKQQQNTIQYNRKLYMKNDLKSSKCEFSTKQTKAEANIWFEKFFQTESDFFKTKRTATEEPKACYKKPYFV